MAAASSSLQIPPSNTLYSVSNFSLPVSANNLLPACKTWLISLHFMCLYKITARTAFQFHEEGMCSGVRASRWLRTLYSMRSHDNQMVGAHTQHHTITTSLSIYWYYLKADRLADRLECPHHGLLGLLEAELCPDSTRPASEAPSEAACCSQDAPTDSLCSAVGWRYKYAARLSAPASGPSTVTACPLLTPTLHEAFSVCNGVQTALCPHTVFRDLSGATSSSHTKMPSTCCHMYIVPLLWLMKGSDVLRKKIVHRTQILPRVQI